MNLRLRLNSYRYQGLRICIPVQPFRGQAVTRFFVAIERSGHITTLVESARHQEFTIMVQSRSRNVWLCAGMFDYSVNPQ